MPQSRKGYAEKHVDLLKILNQSGGPGCYSVRGLAKQANMDQRTAKAHLDVMALHGVGGYVDGSQRVFCTKEGVKNLGEKLGLKFQEQPSQ